MNVKQAGERGGAWQNVGMQRMPVGQVMKLEILRLGLKITSEKVLELAGFLPSQCLGASKLTSLPPSQQNKTGTPSNHHQLTYFPALGHDLLKRLFLKTGSCSQTGATGGATR